MINLKKDDQRKISAKKREALSLKNNTASQILSNHLKNLINFDNYKIIASYISIKSEISTHFLNEFILYNNKTLCLPVIKKNSETLIFRKYDLDTELISGKFGVMEPSELNNELLPEIILTPCLAFDKNGFRLGYGGGYYDKTFVYLRNNKHRFITIAVAFDGQKVNEVVHENFDQKINYILTEKELYKVQ